MIGICSSRDLLPFYALVIKNGENLLSYFLKSDISLVSQLTGNPSVLTGFNLTVLFRPGMESKHPVE